MANTRWLVLEDGLVLKGLGFGSEGDAIGEVVFTTNMTGYTETLTDPSYEGQIVLQTFPLMGNYGVNPKDFESVRPFIQGYLVGEVCTEPSHFASEHTLDTLLQTHGIPGIYGLDTRALTRHIRTHGVLRGVITNHPERYEQDLDQIRRYQIGDAVSRVSTKEALRYSYHESKFQTKFLSNLELKLKKLNIILWDFGVKNSSVARLNERGCDVLVVPSSWTAEEILNEKPDGILLSNGPGDPECNITVIHEIRKLCDAGLVIFGICLGHQLLALANGGATARLKYGHRGGNHPVKDLSTGRTFITSQNHGYAVQLGDHLPKGASPRYVNANDQSCEGLDYRTFPGFSVQFHPEACGGPKDTEFLFDRFVTAIRDQKK